jgi:sigma-B regulation protein RsbU (phosphoserine phosphatase)
VDLGRGLLTYSCAGHPPPVILRSDGVLETLDRRGPAIGLNSDKPYGQEEKELHQGDKVVLYTDGILEAFNPTGEIFGKDRFYGALQKLRNSPVQDIVEALYTEVKDFAKTVEFNDDITILIAEYLG